MSGWKRDSKLGPKEGSTTWPRIRRDLRDVIDPETSPDDWAADAKVKTHPGRAPFYRECADCHTMGNLSEREKKRETAPDLFAWGSSRWTARMIKAPGHPSLYGYYLEEEQKMPAFGEQLTESDVTALVRYLKGDYPAPARP